MNLGTAARNVWRRRAMLALALTALALKVLVPQGYMAAERSGPGFPLVLCTAEGRVTLDTGDQHTPPEKTKSDACVFAGNLTPPAPALFAVAMAQGEAYVAVRPTAAPDQLPGRGLAAPPPPAVGPPVLI